MLVHLTDGNTSSINFQAGSATPYDVLKASIDHLEDVIELGKAPLIVDADLANIETVRKLKALLPPKRDDAIWLFVCDRGSRVSEVRAAALGATKILTRPVNLEQLYQCLAGALAPPAHADEAEDTACASSVASGGLALKNLFRCLVENNAVPIAELSAAADTIGSGIEKAGVSRWLDVVRQHHSGTYQHCLLVTGVATAFARKLRLSKRDTTTITIAGLVHDIGKARIPTAILDKPGKLTEQEFALMKLHPVYGHEFLVKAEDLNSEVVEAARHHHEYLDGSGYPDRLAGSRIRDVTRILTISDIFGALLEKRSYKPPMPSKQAYDVLAKMAGQGLLEPPLVAAFRDVAADIA